MVLLCFRIEALPQGEFLKKLGLNSAAGSGPMAGLALDDSQIVAGLKEALGNGVKQAVNNLGKADGFLKDVNVRILLPEGLKKVDRSMRLLGQGQLVDQFVTTMNRAAEQATPMAAEVLGDAVRKMSIADARSILTGTNNAATQFFRRTSETNLHSRLLPIVQKATASAGVTGAYKQMIAKAGIAGQFLGSDVVDVDAYVTRKSLDGLFLKISDEEKRIRDNPAARTTDLLQKVFGKSVPVKAP